MVTFLFIRHGLSSNNYSGRFTGQIDTPLHEIGNIQAQDVMRYLVNSNYNIDAVYSSSSSRAYNTVLPTATALSLPIKTMDELMEIDVGNWGGRTFEELSKAYPEAYRLFRENVGLARYGDGESTEEAQARIIRAVEKIASENDGKTVLIATHGGVLRALYCAWSDIPLSELKDVKIVPNASLSVANYENKKAKFLLLGNNEYLTIKTPLITKQTKNLS